MSRNKSIYMRQQDFTNSLRSMRDRMAKLAVALLEDESGVPERAYRELQCLFAEVGGMPELPFVEAENGRIYQAAGMLD